MGLERGITLRFTLRQAQGEEPTLFHAETVEACQETPMSESHPLLVLSGMQPTNTLHLGNYLGALKNWVRMQNEMPSFFCVVDMHALTQESGYAKAEDVSRATREVAAAYIAAGVDPKRTPIFNQSRVHEHAEL